MVIVLAVRAVKSKYLLFRAYHQIKKILTRGESSTGTDDSIFLKVPIETPIRFKLRDSLVVHLDLFPLKAARIGATSQTKVGNKAR